MKRLIPILIGLILLAGCILPQQPTAQLNTAASGDPTQFGNSTTTTAWIGGTLGNITGIGAIQGKNLTLTGTTCSAGDALTSLAGGVSCFTPSSTGGSGITTVQAGNASMIVQNGSLSNFSVNMTFIAANIPTYNNGTSNLTLAQVAESVGNWSGNQSNYYNQSVANATYYKSGSNASLASLNVTSTLNVTGNITTYGYFMGQPLLGMMGSGMIESSSAGTKSTGVNVTCAGLTCNYSNFTMRITSPTSAAFATYCVIPNGTLTVPDNTFTAYYIDINCAVQSTTYETWFSTTMSNGGAWDFAYVLTQNGQTEVIDSISLEQRRMMKQRILNYYTQQGKVISGFGIQTPATIAAGFNITAGKTVFGMDVVDVNQHNVNATAGNHIEMVGHNGSTSNWSFTDFNYLNITDCDNGTAVVACTGTTWRRSFIFMVGYDGGLSSSELHALYPRLNTTYGSAATCLDTTVNPLVYTMPTQYNGAVVLLYAYCTQRTATTWNTANLIDLRTVKTGFATGGTDISGLVPYSGATGNVNLGVYNLTANATNATQYNVATGGNLGGNTTCTKVSYNSTIWFGVGSAC